MPIGPENFLATIAIATILSLMALWVLSILSAATKELRPGFLLTWSSNAIQLAAILLLFSSLGLALTGLSSCMKTITPASQSSTAENAESAEGGGR